MAVDLDQRLRDLSRELVKAEQREQFTFVTQIQADIDTILDLILEARYALPQT